MPRLPVTQVVLEGVGFPEALRWRDGRLWFSDLQERQVYSFEPGSGITSTITRVPGVPSGLGWTARGELLVVSMWDGRVVRLHGAELVTVADLAGLVAPPWNDMVTDPSGRGYVGNVGYDFVRGERPRPTVLALIDVDGAVRPAAADLMCPNGAVLTPDGRNLIVAETLGHRLTAFDIASDGSLHGRRTWADLGSARPDGIALDTDGACWVAAVGSPRVIRISAGGSVTAEVVASQPAVACAVDGSTLYVGTAPGSSRDYVGRRAGRIERATIHP